MMPKVFATQVWAKAINTGPEIMFYHFLKFRSLGFF